jgi:hypothetical protein
VEDLHVSVKKVQLECDQKVQHLGVETARLSACLKTLEQGLERYRESEKEDSRVLFEQKVSEALVKFGAEVLGPKIEDIEGATDRRVYFYSRQEF